MGEHSRYSVSDAEGSGVLQNKLGITDQQKLDDVETLLLADTYDHFFSLLQKRKIHFDLALLFEIHRFFLGTLYPWAGKLRTVDVSKDNVFFASVRFLDDSMKKFSTLLEVSQGHRTDTMPRIAEKLAVIHNELNALHPFREGNGRTIRLFLDLMAVDAGYQPINWSKRSQRTYLRACKNGMETDHKPMTRFILAGLSKRRS